jgi:hypothetical protein
VWEVLLPTHKLPEHPRGNWIYASAVETLLAAEIVERPTTSARIGSPFSARAALQILPSWSMWLPDVFYLRIYATLISTIKLGK